jgi:L-threonylcarbamoyladenylate synthase
MDVVSENELLEAVAILERGDLIGLPTETVYGLAADGTNPVAVARIFEVKGRPRAHPLILHLGAASWLDDYAENVPDSARRLAARFWPGPLTMVLWRRKEHVPDEVTGGLETVALRVPGHAVALQVILSLGRPLAAPSANRFGGVSPTTRQHVLDDLGDDVPFVLEGGPSSVGLESTIVDLTGPVPRLLRPGGVSRDDLEGVLGVQVLDGDEHAPAAPGTLESHYAPRAKVVLVSESEIAVLAQRLAQAGVKVGVISTETFAEGADHVLRFHLEHGVQAQAHDLYQALRHLDEQGCEQILTSLPAPDGIGAAVADRLIRAAAPRPSK